MNRRPGGAGGDRTTEVVTADWVLPIDGAPIRDGAVAFAGGRIEAVGPRAEVGGAPAAPGSVLIPGFVNAHAHLEYATFAGFGDGLPFGPWIALHVRRKRLLDLDGLKASARLGVHACLASGITTVADASFAGASAEACAQAGLRAIVHAEVFGPDPAAAHERFEELSERIRPALGELVSLGVSPHAPYSTGVEVYRQSLALGLPVQTHLGESADEDAFMREGSGPIHQLATMLGISPPGTTGVRQLAREGLLGPAITAAHCVTVDDEERRLLAAHDVAVAHCPRSNAMLGCGLAPLRELLDAGLRVGLGTDSPASTPSFDMFAEAQAAVQHSRARERSADALSASHALELATLGSARALRLDGIVGSLSVGKRADMTLLDLAETAYVPWEDPAAAVVFAGSPSHVSRTIVDGATRYERGRFEWHEVRGAATAARASMLADLTAGS